MSSLRDYIDFLNESIIEKKVGKHRHIPDSKFDPKQLKMGIEIEMEHTDDKSIAKEIAKDHLMECKTYYTRLEKMEKECEKAEKG